MLCLATVNIQKLSTFHSLTKVTICSVSLIPYAINAGLTRFDKGQSTHAQRVWTMTWLTFGVVHAIGIGSNNVTEKLGPNVMDVILSLVFCAPAVGGFVVVGQMLTEYGHCTLL